MMRGARQGNNAFMQDNKRNEEYKSMLQQLNEDEILAVRIAYSCNLEMKTLRLISKELKEEAFPFFKQIYYHILRTGRRYLAAQCLEILREIGDQETKDSITQEMIDILQLDDKKATKKIRKSLKKEGENKFDPQHKFEGVSYLHLA